MREHDDPCSHEWYCAHLDKHCTKTRHNGSDKTLSRFLTSVTENHYRITALLDGQNIQNNFLDKNSLVKTPLYHNQAQLLHAGKEDILLCHFVCLFEQHC